jgi:hypothetical protein
MPEGGGKLVAVRPGPPAFTTSPAHAAAVRAAPAACAARRRSIAAVRAGARRRYRGWSTRRWRGGTRGLDGARDGGQRRGGPRRRGCRRDSGPRGRSGRLLSRAAVRGADDHCGARAAEEERAEHHGEEQARGEAVLLWRSGPRWARWRTVPIRRVSLWSRAVGLSWWRSVSLRRHWVVGLRRRGAHRVAASSARALRFLSRRGRRALHRADDVAAHPLHPIRASYSRSKLYRKGALLAGPAAR